MPLPARLTIILLAALLTACAGRSPVLEPSGVPPEPVSATAANDVLFRALGLVGTPYRYGGNTPGSGFDCSGLIGYVYRDAAGLALPRTTQQMSQAQGANVRREALQAGDLVFFATSGGRRVSHAGIYVGEGRFVHAPSSGGTVRLDSLGNRYWNKTYLGAKRVLGKPALARNP
ncbi:C40 family peptidase [Pseudomonadota bacterium DY0742]|uniref:C40 family peptidase n=1 Tax=Stutzerimonas balearica TaxID=74829 RepID=UPI001BC9E881|nr:C40 family peptidase [Stutzerimonas balearica]MBS4151002.1 peptidoglycan endopeptidase [Stutzerimonas balearica]